MKRLRLRRCFFVLVFALVSCNTPAKTPTPLPSLTPTRINTPPLSATASPTKAVITIHAKDQPVNCRFGPGTVFDIIDGLHAYQSTQAEGRSVDSMWLYIENPGNPGGYCWVALTAVEIDGTVGVLSVVTAPPVTVTALEVSVDPPRISVSCSAFPQVFGFAADITTNGPTEVVMRWEVNTGDTTPNKTLIFERAGKQHVQEFYKVNGPNDYKVKLHVLGPNEMIQEANFFANCTP